MPRIVGIALLVGLMAAGTGPAGNGIGSAAPATAAAAVRQAAAPLTTTAGIRRARRFARGRLGTVAFAVLEPGQRPRGLLRTTPFPSASVSKAMLLVSILRRAGAGPLTEAERGLLPLMITRSDNNAASAIYGMVGGEGLRKVALAAGMKKFVDVGHWGRARITAADQARLFLQIDKLVPVVHRRYARRLLSSIVPEQRWGIAPAARREHVKIFFKGGWRANVTHQVALLERGGKRIALAVLTNGSPSQAYCQETIERIADRVIE